MPLRSSSDCSWGFSSNSFLLECFGKEFKKNLQKITKGEPGYPVRPFLVRKFHLYGASAESAHRRCWNYRITYPRKFSCLIHSGSLVTGCAGCHLSSSF